VDSGRKNLDGAYFGFFGILSGTAKNINFVSAAVINTVPLNAAIIAGKMDGTLS